MDNKIESVVEVHIVPGERGFFAEVRCYKKDVEEPDVLYLNAAQTMRVVLDGPATITVR